MIQSRAYVGWVLAFAVGLLVGLWARMPQNSVHQPTRQRTERQQTPTFEAAWLRLIGLQIAEEQSPGTVGMEKITAAFDEANRLARRPRDRRWMNEAADRSAELAARR